MRKLLLFLVFSGLAWVLQPVKAQSTDSLKQYTGTYVFPDGSVVPDVTVELSDSILTMNSTAGSSILVKQGDDLFAIVEFSGTALFKRNDTGKINAVHIEAGGYILDGTKKEDALWSYIISRRPQAVKAR